LVEWLERLALGLGLLVELAFQRQLVFVGRLVLIALVLRL